MLIPSLDEFRALASRGNTIPVRTELLADTETPLSAYQKLARAHPADTFLFESVEGGEHIGRYSFIGLNPRAVLTVRGDCMTFERDGRTRRSRAPRDPLAAAKELLAPFRPVRVSGLPRFTGGLVGYLGFEYLSRVEPVPSPPKDDLGLPLMKYLLVDTLVIFDRARQILQIVANAHVEGNPDTAWRTAAARIRAIERVLATPLAAPPASFSPEIPDAVLASNMPKEEYLGMVARGKRYIRQGDIFQFVPSQRFSAPTRATPLEIYRALRTINPSPYMFLMRFADFALVGASPEIHVRCEEGLAEIRPIAGTRKRGATAEEDARLEKELLADAKERAEHLMLVDLARNDLGRVCEFNSVTVPQFMIVERYSHVMHIVSQVTGRLRPGQDAFDVMRATFPAGTVSGAPKIRAMQIISELERRVRGPYGGALGYFDFSGNLDTCIAIRTLVLKEGVAYVQAGGGVVDDSTPEGEYQETVNKARALAKALALAESFRTKDASRRGKPQSRAKAARLSRKTVGALKSKRRS
ncbi:MAG: anthranilate synthase component I [Verrucomicrobiae bacterium]|nr:anthranilate synthase component I [Verrucomicrobiae bacterium]